MFQKRNKLGQFIKGNVPFDRTGILHTEETKNKLKKARKNRQPRKPIEMIGKKFNRWMVIKQVKKKGRQFYWLCKCDCGTKKIVSGGALRAKRAGSKSCGCFQKELIGKRNRKNCGEKNYNFGKKGFFAGKKRPEHSKRMIGNGNSNWKGGITPDNRKIRNSERTKIWRKEVFKKDNWTCQKTGIIGGNLTAHHIQNFANFTKLRFEVSNGITFSKESHREFHNKYGTKNNTKEQLQEFLCQ